MVSDEPAALMLGLAVAGFAAALALTEATRRLAWRRRIVAVPNARSSHATPVAGIGGIGFVAPVAAWLIWSAPHGGAFAVALAGGALALALVGLLDDLRDLSAALRLTAHLIVAGALVAALGETGLIVGAALTVALAWFVNLYNFMDGIDGLAASQAVLFCLGALWFGEPGGLAPALGLLAAACMGFLCLNWPPAKIIMGDVGSYFLGFVIGAIALGLGFSDGLPWVMSAILLAVFWVDASYTLLARWLTGQRVASAHRNHAYQKLARRFGHGRVTVGLWALSLVWFAPLAALNGRFSELAPLWLALAAAPCLAACIAFRAGLPDDTPHG